MKRVSKVAVISLLSQLAVLSNGQAFADDASAGTSSGAAKNAASPTSTSTSTSSASAATATATTSSSTAPGGGTASSKAGVEAQAPVETEVNVPKNFAQTSTKVSTTNCKIKCLDPHAPTEEAAQVIDVLQQMYIAYADKDLGFFEHHLTQDCTTFYEGDQKVILGKKAALADIKDWTDKEAKVNDAPLQEIVLDHPYCNVNEGHAVITFTAYKEIGGAHPGKFKSHVNDVFKKNDGTWELLTHFRSSWREVK
jgi:hypothetical protein